MDYESGIAVATIWQEARGRNCSGQERRLIAQTIKNRTRMRYCSDGTVVGTCLWNLQFSGWSERSIIIKSLTAASADSASDLLDDWNLGEPEYPNVVNYYSPASMTPPGAVPRWAAGRTPILTTPNFRFYDALS